MKRILNTFAIATLFIAGAALSITHKTVQVADDPVPRCGFPFEPCPDPENGGPPPARR